MESISRTASDFAAPQRQAIEQVLGHPLRDDQQVTISVRPELAEPAVSALPEWLDLYAGLTDEEVSDLEGVILERDRSARVIE